MSNYGENLFLVCAGIIFAMHYNDVGWDREVKIVGWVGLFAGLVIGAIYP